MQGGPSSHGRFHPEAHPLKAEASAAIAQKQFIGIVARQNNGLAQVMEPERAQKRKRPTPL
jgi:hypothetical protein